jgi:enoyl-CoA hydratase
MTRSRTEQAGLIVALDDGIARITIDRPRTRNNLTLELVDTLGRLIDELAEAGTRVAIIEGAGDKAFSSGFDINALDVGGTVSPDGMFDLDRRLDAAFRMIEQAPFPVIAGIRGHCIGGGLELAMSCDLRIATDDASFRMPPAMLGWVYALSGLRRFTTAIGAARARMLFLTGEPLDARRAEAWGLIHEVHPAADWRGRIEQMAARMASAAPIALAGLKQGIATVTRASSLEEDFREHLRLRAASAASADLREGREAALARRAPKFTGG